MSQCGTVLGTFGVTFVIPVGRVDSFLDEAVVSALEQRDCAVEVRVILNGEAALRKGYKHSDPRVVVQRLPGKGGTARAINYGVTHAKYDLIGQLDADDVAEPTRAAVQAAHLFAHPDAVCVGAPTTLIDDAGRPIAVEQTISKYPQQDLRFRLVVKNVITHSSLIYRKRAWEEVGGYDEKSVRMQDYEFLLRLAREGEVHQMSTPLVRYRIHPDQVSRNSPVLARSTVRILKNRFDLRAVIGESRILGVLEDAAWLGWQILRQAGAVRPRKLSRATMLDRF